MGVIAVGTKTINDLNDGKPVQVLLSVPAGYERQTYTPESAVDYSPDFTQNNVVITPSFRYGGVDKTSLLTSVTWSESFDGAALTTGTDYTVEATAPFRLTRKTNLTASALYLYFKGTFTDPDTGFVLTIRGDRNILKDTPGAAGIVISFSGIYDIAENPSPTKLNCASLVVKFAQGGSIKTNVKYKWYKFPFAADDLLSASNGDEYTAGNVRFKTTADSTNYPTDLTTGIVEYKNGASYSVTHLTAPAGTISSPQFEDLREILISEELVQEVGYFKVVCRPDDQTDVTHEAYFQVTDYSDPYDINILGSEALQNGEGSTVLSVEIWCGSSQISAQDAAGYTYRWFAKDRYGQPAGLVDTAKTGSSPKAVSGAPSGSTINITGTWLSNPVAGNYIKTVTMAKVITYYEVASATSNSAPSPKSTSWHERRNQLNLTQYI